MISEILIPRSGFGSDDGKAARNVRQGQLLLHVHIPLLREALNDALPLQSLFA